MMKTNEDLKKKINFENFLISPDKIIDLLKSKLYIEESGNFIDSSMDE